MSPTQEIPTVDWTEAEMRRWFENMLEQHVNTCISMHTTQADENATRKLLSQFVQGLHREHYELISMVGSKLGLDSEMTYAEGRQKIEEWSHE